MKILNYLNISELINEIKKNNLSTNIVFISSLMLPFSFFLGPATMEPLIFLICINYLYILISKKEKIIFNTIIIFFFKFLFFFSFLFFFIKFYINLFKVFFIINKIFCFNFCNYIYFKKIKSFFEIFFYFRFFMCELNVYKWINTIFFRQKLLHC